MSTIINNPPSGSTNSMNPMGMILGLAMFVVFIIVVFVYVIPALNHIQVGSPQIQVPSKVDVNVSGQGK